MRFVIVSFLFTLFLFYLPKLSLANKYFSGYIEYSPLTGSSTGPYKIQTHLYVHKDSLMPDSIVLNITGLSFEKVGKIDSFLLGNNTIHYIYSIEYTFPITMFQTVQYTIYYIDSNAIRIGINMPTSLPFYLATTITIEWNGISPNTSVKFYDKPIIIAKYDTPFYFNATPIDYNGDSLFFEFKTNYQNYWLPQNLIINPKSGEIRWLNPDSIGIFEFTLLIKEFSSGGLVTYTFKNFLIQVDSLYSSNNFDYIQNWNKNNDGYYEYHLKPDENLQLVFSYQDTIADSINIFSYSELYSLNNPASFNSITSNNLVYGLFNWTPANMNVRSNPYILNFISFSRLLDSTYFYNYITVLIYVENTTSVKENFKDYVSYLLFPNPSFGLLNIHFQENAEGYINLLDSRGTLVKQWKINAAKGQIMQVDIETFSPGIYLIQLQTEKDFQTAKFIKQ